MSKWMTPKFRVGFAPPSPPIDPPLFASIPVPVQVFPKADIFQLATPRVNRTHA